MSRSSFHVLVRILVVAALILPSATVAWSASYKVIHAFNTRSENPSSGLVVDLAGNAYGTTAAGGFHGGKGGTVYQLSPTKGFSLIYAFSGPDGMKPQGNLVVDPAGNLYGTTVYGGANTAGCNNQGCGTVFRLSPPTNSGAWTETVLYSFSGGADGGGPQAGVVLDAVGNIYGTTTFGGISNCFGQEPGCGTVFELTPSQSGWAESVLYTFSGGNNDGGLPQCRLTFDAAGNIYGTSGAVVFQLSPNGSEWNFQEIYRFSSQNGDAVGAETGVIFDTEGNLYGTSPFGGAFNAGTVFELTLVSGEWKESVIHSFAGGNDGATPESSPVLDPSGNLYGTTFAGGGTGCLGNGCGTVFKLTRTQGGEWTESRFLFGSNQNRGSQPTDFVLIDEKGTVYGTTSTGGKFSRGVVYRIIP